MSPRPLGDHNSATFEFGFQLRGQLPQEYEILLDIDVDGCHLQTGRARRPDLIVVLAVLEVRSAGSRRTDNVLTRVEYAEAGIPHYWLIDADEPVSLLACHLAGEFGYVDSGAVTGTFTTDAPFPLTIDLDALL